MAEVKAKMVAIGNEPQTCLRTFKRGETMYAVLYFDGEPAGWHLKKCIEFWKRNGIAKCVERTDG